MLKFYKEKPFPMEMHKSRFVQKINLLPIDERLKKIKEAGNNTFLLRNKDVFLDMLTDSGTNAMSIEQLSAMSLADDSYAGSETFYRLEKELQRFFNKQLFLPAHQGRACENIIAKAFVKKGNIIPMNYHFTTTKAHINLMGGKVVELYTSEAIKPVSNYPFKGNMDLDKLKDLIKKEKDNIPFLRLEMGTNLIGGQPISLKNIKEVSKICKENKILVIIDASLLADNLYFIKTREEEYKDKTILEINHEIANCADIIYFSARKLGFVRGGGIVLNNKELFDLMKPFVTLYEGFLTYGGMSVREMEALRVGLEETLDYDVISQGPIFIEELVKKLIKYNVPVITPAGGLGCHVNAMEFVPHIKQEEYPAAALAAALYIVSGARGMERGTLSEERDENGKETLANMELLRLALPRRVFSLSHVNYIADRLCWLYENRNLIKGLKFVEEPKVLRFFTGRLEEIGTWQEELVKKFKEDFNDSL